MEKSKLIFFIEPNQIVLLYHNTKHAFVFDEYEMVDGIICNQTKIRGIIKHFLFRNKLVVLPAIVVFSQGFVHEQLLKPTDLHIDLASRIYVKANINESLNYLAVLQPSQLLQFQLLFWQIALYVELFTAINLLYIKNLAQLENSTLGTATNLDDLHLLDNVDNNDLYINILQAVEKIHNN